MPKSKKPKVDIPEDLDLLERGQKQRAGRMLSEYLRAIGQEVDQVIDVEVAAKSGPPRIERRLVSKAEALARWLWKAALPPQDMVGLGPNLDVVKIVLDRCEGKPGVQGQEAEDGREGVPERISRMNRDRVNSIAEEAVEGE